MFARRGDILILGTGLHEAEGELLAPDSLLFTDMGADTDFVIRITKKSNNDSVYKIGNAQTVHRNSIWALSVRLKARKENAIQRTITDSNQKSDKDVIY